MDLILKITAIVAAVRAKNILLAAALTASLVTMILESLASQPQVMHAHPAMKAAYVTAESQTIDTLANDLEGCCQADGGPLIDVLLPVLMVLLRKLLNF